MLWPSVPTNNTISVISTATHTVVGSPILVGTGPDALAISPDGKTLYVANVGDNTNVGTISVIATGSQ